MIHSFFRVGIVICVHGLCFCRINIQFVLIFVNPNLIQIVNKSTFLNQNLAYLLFVSITLTYLSLQDTKFLVADTNPIKNEIKCN